MSGSVSQLQLKGEPVMGKVPRKKDQEKRPGTGLVASSPWPTRLAGLMAVLVIGTSTLIRIGFREIPMERDEGTYAYMGGLVLQGAVPYVDFLEMKPPGLYYSYALLHALSGGDATLMHVWMALLWAGGATLLYSWARRWFDAGAALVTTVAYGSLSLSAHASGFTIQADHIVAFLTIAGFWAVDTAVRRSSRALMVLAGGLLCWSVLVKQNAVVFAVFAPLLILIMHRASGAEGRQRRTWMDIGRLACGAAIPGGLVVLIMVIQGNLEEFWFCAVQGAGMYADQMRWSDAPALLGYTLRQLFTELPVAWVMGALGVPLLWSRELDPWKRWALIGSLVVSILSVAPGKRFLGHYFLHFFPAFSLCAGATAYIIPRRLASVLGQGAALWGSTVLGAGMFLSTILLQGGYYFKEDHTALLRRVYHTNPFPEARVMADLINERYQDGDGLFVVGSEPQIYVYTRTRAPSRFIYMNFLVQNHPSEKAWRSEVMRDLEAAPPKYVVWVQHVGSWMPAPGADQGFLEKYWNELHRDYEVIAWCEQTASPDLIVVTGEEARNYQPKGQLYMFLAERKRDAGATGSWMPGKNERGNVPHAFARGTLRQPSGRTLLAASDAPLNAAVHAHGCDGQPDTRR